MKIALIGLVVVALLIGFVPSVRSEAVEQGDVTAYYELAIIKASLLPIQAEMNNKEKPPSAEAAKQYDVVAKAFNAARESLNLLETAKKLGSGEAKVRKQFYADVEKAKMLAGQFWLGKGVLP